MIYKLRHETRYDYVRDVDVATHYVHLGLRTLPWQRVISSSINATPQPSHFVTGLDCFGNGAGWLFMDTPHPRFAVVLDAVVEIGRQPCPDADATLAWEAVVQAAAKGGVDTVECTEFLYASPMIMPFAAMRAYSAVSFPPGCAVMAGLVDLTMRIRREFAFRTDASEIGTSLATILAQKAGVCQDFSHLMIAGLRALGLPARYASGYIRTRPPPGGKKLRGADQSHAWVSCWLGPAHGWLDVDPTNGVIVADEHVVLAYGRDFADVSPVLGVILGGGAHKVRVSVDLEPAEMPVRTS